MAGQGPAPKPPDRRAGHRTDPIPATKLRFERAVQPPLPAGVDWHPRTRQWWEMWGKSPQSEHFMASDWDFLVDTARLHHAVWSGNLGYAAEVRLRVAKYGATPEDRARLRMQFADADEKDSKRPAAPSSARERYGQLRALPVREGADAVEGSPVSG